MAGATWTVYLNNIDDKESNVLLRMASQVGRQSVLAGNKEGEKLLTGVIVQENNCITFLL